MVSAVIYLNQDWLPEQGGQLRMYLDGETEYDVDPPAAGWWCSSPARCPTKSCPRPGSACP